MEQPFLALAHCRGFKQMPLRRTRIFCAQLEKALSADGG